MQVYSITRAGEKALVKAQGNSSNPRLPRIVMFEMLASNKTPNAEYLRLQRVFLLKSISNFWKTLEQIQATLKKENLNLPTNAVADNISRLVAIGLNISERQGEYKLLDKITCLKREVCTFHYSREKTVSAAKEQFEKVGLYLRTVCGVGSIDADDIRKIVERYKYELDSLPVVFVDYLQILKTHDPL